MAITAAPGVTTGVIFVFSEKLNRDFLGERGIQIRRQNSGEDRNMELDTQGRSGVPSQ